MTQELKRSPLAHRTPISDAANNISLAERPFQGLLVLRGAHGRISGAVQSAVGIELPDTAGTFTETTDAAALWIGPDEWVIVTRPDAQHDTMASLQTELAKIHSQVVDVSDYYTTLSVGGAAAREVLAKITMIDLHPRAFAKGHAVASVFGNAGAWLQMVEDEDSGEQTGGPKFALYVRRSMADYLWCLIADGAREFGMIPQEPIGRVKLHLPHFEPSH